MAKVNVVIESQGDLLDEISPGTKKPKGLIEKVVLGKPHDVSLGKDPLFNCSFTIWGPKSEAKAYLEDFLQDLSNELEEMVSCWRPGSEKDLEIHKHPQG